VTRQPLVAVWNLAGPSPTGLRDAQISLEFGCGELGSEQRIGVWRTRPSSKAFRPLIGVGLQDIVADGCPL
jgi:hypothetical protein